MQSFIQLSYLFILIGVPIFCDTIIVRLFACRLHDLRWFILTSSSCKILIFLEEVRSWKECSKINMVLEHRRRFILLTGRVIKRPVTLDVLEVLAHTHKCTVNIYYNDLTRIASAFLKHCWLPKEEGVVHSWICWLSREVLASTWYQLILH